MPSATRWSRRYGLAVDEADADPDVRVGHPHGRGPVFLGGVRHQAEGGRSAGGGPRRPGDRRTTSSTGGTGTPTNTDQFTHFWKLGVPIIAAVRGYCFGGGFWYSMGLRHHDRSG